MLVGLNNLDHCISDHQIGLCTNLRNLPWYSTQSAEEFYPRCFKLTQEEDRNAFVDDYRTTACIGLLKYALIKHLGLPEDEEPDVHITSSDEIRKMKAESEAAAANNGGNSSGSEQQATLNSFRESKNSLNQSLTETARSVEQPVKTSSVPSNTIEAHA